MIKDYFKEKKRRLKARQRIQTRKRKSKHNSGFCSLHVVDEILKAEEHVTKIEQGTNSTGNIFLTVDDNTHNDIIQKYQKLFPIYANANYFTSKKDLEKDWNLKDFHHLKNNYYLERKSNKNIDKNKKIDIKKVQELSNKYEILQKNNMITVSNKDGKKALGILYPTPNILDFYYEELFFISPSLIKEVYGEEPELNIFENNEPNTYNIYSYMSANGYEDINIYKFDDFYWRIEGFKNGRNTIIDENAFDSYKMDKLTKALMIDIKKSIADKSSLLTSTVSFDDYNENSLKIGGKTYRISFTHQSKLSPDLIMDKLRNVHIRMMDSSSNLRATEDIGYLPEDLEYIKKAFYDNQTVQNNAIVFGGMPGSGKSSTIFSLVKENYIKHLISYLSIDRTQEFDIPGVRMVSIEDTENAENEKIKLSYDNLLPHFNKVRADGIIFGELLYENEIKGFIQKGRDGRQVIATIHIGRCQELFNRIEMNGVKRDEYNNLIRLIVHHDLCPRICQNCKDKEETEKQKCEECNGTGISGRELIYEYVYMPYGAVKDNHKLSTDDFHSLIKEKKVVYKSKSDIALKKYKMGLITEYTLKSIQESEKND